MELSYSKKLHNTTIKTSIHYSQGVGIDLHHPRPPRAPGEFLKPRVKPQYGCCVFLYCIIQMEAKKTIYMIRHGESIANVATDEMVDCTPQKFRDAPLTRRGRKQAAVMRSVCTSWNLNLVVVSPMRRCMQVRAIECLFLKYLTAY